MISTQIVPKNLEGLVVHGKGRGRLVGMPTANIDLSEGYTMPKAGVYAGYVWVEGFGDRRFIGVTNVGLRPSDDDSNEPTVETHILDFDSDIYDKKIKVTLIKFLRPVMVFKNLQEVKNQVDKDIVTARTAL